MYDVLIAGAGSAGAALAGMLAARGHGVLLVESRPRDRIGHDWCGYVENRTFQITGVGGPEEGESRGPVRELIIASPDLRAQRTVFGYPAHILDRRLFARRLVAQAEAAGAEVRDETRVLYPLYDERKVFGAAIESDGEVENIMARVTVDATGIDAHLRTRLPPEWDIDTRPPERADTVRAYHEVREFNEREAMEPSVGVLSLRYGQNGWYSWVNRETRDRIDFGCGVLDVEGAPDPAALTRSEAEGWKGVSKKVVRAGGGRLPARRAIENLVWDGFIALGDAACQAMPLNGANTGTALLAARIAADVLDAALARSRVGIDSLWPYNVQYQRGRGATLAQFDAFRRTMRALSADELSYLFRRNLITADILSRAWHIRPLSHTPLRTAMNLLRGATRPGLAQRINEAANAASEILHLYHRYPQNFDAAKVRSWIAAAREHFARIDAR